MSLKSFFKTMFGLGQKVEVIKDTNDSRDDKLENIFLNRDNNILTSLRELSNDRLSRIADYREMLKDGVTMSAVELISEDASLIDADTNLAAWVESADNPDFAEMATDFLKNKLRINDVIYPIAFNVVAFGENISLEEAIEIIKTFITTPFSSEERHHRKKTAPSLTTSEPDE